MVKKLSEVRKKQYERGAKNRASNKSSRAFARGFSDLSALKGTQIETGKSGRDLLKAEGARRRKLKATDKTKRPDSKFKPHGYTQGDKRKD